MQGSKTVQRCQHIVTGPLKSNTKLRMNKIAKKGTKELKMKKIKAKKKKKIGKEKTNTKNR